MPFIPFQKTSSSFTPFGSKKKEEESLGQKITKGIQSVFPGKELGTAIGTSIYGIGSLIKGDKAGFEESARANEEAMPRIIGDVAKSVILPASLAVAPAKTVFGKAAQFGGISGAYGGAESLSQGKDLKQVARDTFTAGLSGAAVGGLIGMAAKGARAFSQNAPHKIYNNALRVLQRIKMAGRSPSKFLVEEGTWGGLGSFKKAATEGIKAESKIIMEKAASTPGGATYGEIKNAAISAIKQKFGGLYSDAQIAQMIDDVPLEKLKTGGIVNWNTVNEVRSSLGSLIGDTKWLSSNPTEKTQAAQAVYRAMAKLLQKVTKTEQEFSRLSSWIQTNKVVDRAVDMADNKFGFGLYDILSGLGGATYGGLQGQSASDRLKNAAIYGVSAVTMERALNSPAIKTALAQIIEKNRNMSPEALNRLLKTEAMRLIGEFTAK